MQQIKFFAFTGLVFGFSSKLCLCCKRFPLLVFLVFFGFSFALPLCDKAFAFPLEAMPFHRQQKALFILDSEDLVLPPQQESNLSLAQRKQKADLSLPFYYAKLKKSSDVQQASKVAKEIQAAQQQTGSQSCDLLFYWAGVAIKQRHYGKALDFLDNLITLKPDFAQAWLRRGFVHAQNLDFALAIADLHQAIAFNDKDFQAFALLGSLAELQDKRQLAIKFYQKALNFYPQWQKVQRRLAFLLEQETATPV